MAGTFFLVCEMYKEAFTGEFVCSWQNLLWTIKTWRYSVLYCHSWKCWYLLYFSWLRNTQSFSNFLKALLTVSVITFPVILIMQNICNLIGWNSVHVFDIFNYYRANINGMGNAEKLGRIYKIFQFTLT